MTLELGLESQLPEDKPYSVSFVMEGVRDWVNRLRPVWVEGEVSDLTKARSGHWYFTLKDRRSCMSCVMWADDVKKLRLDLQPGLAVYASGRLTVYPVQGRLQFTVRQLLHAGAEGLHAARLEAARQSLMKDGLLDPDRKRPLPLFPSVIGVLTSPDGAAWHDVVSVVARRWPACQLVLIGARVQGDEAVPDILRALSLAARSDALDVLIVGRGGGSKDDLHAFNDERVARAVAASPVPTISAVGHEVDITLTDLVADLRAATPSAAAEKAVPDRRELIERLQSLGARVAHGTERCVAEASLRLGRMGERMGALAARRVHLADQRLAAAAHRMDAACGSRFERARASAERSAASLDALSPLRVLARGYSVATGEQGRVLRKVTDFKPGMDFTLRVTDGDIRAEAQ